MKSEGHAVHSDGRPSRWSDGYRPPRAPAGEAGDGDIRDANPAYTFEAHGDASKPQSGRNVGSMRSGEYRSRVGVPRGVQFVHTPKRVGDYELQYEFVAANGQPFVKIRCDCGETRALQRCVWIGTSAPTMCRRCRYKSKRGDGEKRKGTFSVAEVFGLECAGKRTRSMVRLVCDCGAGRTMLETDWKRYESVRPCRKCKL